LNEGFVVYLFSRFHEQLGFEKVLKIGSTFPDCIALKDGKEVRIEFEIMPWYLKSHVKVATYSPVVYIVTETEREYLVTSRSGQSNWKVSYPKDQYTATIYPNGLAEINYKRLPLDYCVCWENRGTKRDYQEGIEIIELPRVPVIARFLLEREYLKPTYYVACASMKKPIPCEMSASIKGRIVEVRGIDGRLIYPKKNQQKELRQIKARLK